MSNRSLSPGGALLRRSKVFSIPTPLPRAIDTSTNGKPVSRTATTPYPTHLSLTTPLSSLKEGDWGLKRPLPLRTTAQTSSPSVRIEAIDTIEKVTSFRSSGDHAITLQKWQELNLPITMSKLLKSDTTPVRRSVFEDDVDNIEKSQDLGSSSPLDLLRWKFKGPWLGGQSNGEFSEYMRTFVKGRKKEFQDYLREECAKTKTTEARIVHTAEGSEGEVPTFKGSDITDEEFNLYVKTIRAGRVVLYKLLRSFLDLPPPIFQEINDLKVNLETIFGSMELKRADKRSDKQADEQVDDPKKEEEIKKEKIKQFQNTSFRTGPPKSHPSAGLSYLRTSAYTPNHPIFGPQVKKAPVQARVILPKNISNSKSRTAVVGFAGFVSSIPAGIESKRDNFSQGFRILGEFSYSQFPGLQFIDVDSETGSKSWVHPNYAEFDSNGHLQISWELGDPSAVAIRTNTTDTITPKPIPVASDPYYWNSKRENKKHTAIKRLSSAGQYGLGSMVHPKVKEKRDRQTLTELDSILDYS